MSISTCALREEGDLYIEAEKAGTEAFLSTPSARRATTTSQAVQEFIENFYPRPP